LTIVYKVIYNCCDCDKLCERNTKLYVKTYCFLKGDSNRFRNIGEKGAVHEWMQKTGEDKKISQRRNELWKMLKICFADIVEAN